MNDVPLSEPEKTTWAMLENWNWQTFTQLAICTELQSPVLAWSLCNLAIRGMVESRDSDLDGEREYCRIDDE